MATQSTGPDESPEVETLQAVVDRVVSWQDGATEETVLEELAKGVDAAGIEVPRSLLDQLARRIHAGADRVDVAHVATAHGDEVEPG